MFLCCLLLRNRGTTQAVGPEMGDMGDDKGEVEDAGERAAAGLRRQQFCAVAALLQSLNLPRTLAMLREEAMEVPDGGGLRGAFSSSTDLDMVVTPSCEDASCASAPHTPPQPSTQAVDGGVLLVPPAPPQLPVRAASQEPCDQPSPGQGDISVLPMPPPPPLLPLRAASQEPCDQPSPGQGDISVLPMPPPPPLLPLRAASQEPCDQPSPGQGDISVLPMPPAPPQLPLRAASEEPCDQPSPEQGDVPLPPIPPPPPPQLPLIASGPDASVLPLPPKPPELPMLRCEAEDMEENRRNEMVWADHQYFSVFEAIPGDECRVLEDGLMLIDLLASSGAGNVPDVFWGESEEEVEQVGRHTPPTQSEVPSMIPFTPTSPRGGDGEEGCAPAEVRVAPTPPIASPKLAPVGVALERFDLKVYSAVRRTGLNPLGEIPIVRGELVAGRYDIEEYLGKAEFSRVVQCMDVNTGSRIINNRKDHLDVGLDEVKVLQYLNSAADPDANNVLRLYDFFYFKEHLCLVCELLGQNLYDFGEFDRSFFSVPRVQRIVNQLLVALRILHGLGMIHCDLKPENVLLKCGRTAQVKLIDFGSTCFDGDDPATYLQSRSYRAPEVILNAPYDGRIDIWSLGAMIPELLTGRVLFGSDSIPVMLSQIQSLRGSVPRWLLRAGKRSHCVFAKNGWCYDVEPFRLYKPQPQELREELGEVGRDDEALLDLVGKMLDTDPRRRLTAEQALAHPFLRREYSFEEVEWCPCPGPSP